MRFFSLCVLPLLASISFGAVACGGTSGPSEVTEETQSALCEVAGRRNEISNSPISGSNPRRRCEVEDGHRECYEIPFTPPTAECAARAEEKRASYPPRYQATVKFKLVDFESETGSAICRITVNFNEFQCTPDGGAEDGGRRND